MKPLFVEMIRVASLLLARTVSCPLSAGSQMGWTKAAEGMRQACSFEGSKSSVAYLAKVESGTLAVFQIPSAGLSLHSPT